MPVEQDPHINTRHLFTVSPDGPPPIMVTQIDTEALDRIATALEKLVTIQKTRALFELTPLQVSYPYNASISRQDGATTLTERIHMYLQLKDL